MQFPKRTNANRLKQFEQLQKVLGIALGNARQRTRRGQVCKAGYYAPLFIHDETKRYTNPACSSLKKNTVELTNQITGRESKTPDAVVFFFKTKSGLFSPIMKTSRCINLHCIILLQNSLQHAQTYCNFNITQIQKTLQMNFSETKYSNIDTKIIHLRLYGDN